MASWGSGGGDWSCTRCGTRNFSHRATCRDCGRIRSRQAGPPCRGDWTCSCSEVNFASRSSCRSCSKARPADRENPNDWRCAKCQTINFARRVACFKCGAQRATDAPTEGQLGSLAQELERERQEERERAEQRRKRAEQRRKREEEELRDRRVALEEEAKKIAQQKADLGDNVQCRICCAEPMTMLCVPCNHLFCCDRCAATLATCAVCRGGVVRFDRVYRA